MRLALTLASAPALALALGACATPPGGHCDRPVMVFAAASLRDAMQDASAGFSHEVTFNFAGSNTLALQIESTPAADLFISADEAWMDRLEQGDKLVAGSRRTLLSNELVVIAHASVHVSEASAAILTDPAFSHVSLADPEAVPAGRYAKAWLQSQGLWDEVAPRVAPAADVRAALHLVEADPKVIGIVYATDAETSDGVVVVLPIEDGPKIQYPAALVRRDEACRAASKFLDHLEASDDVFARHGFEAL